MAEITVATEEKIQGIAQVNEAIGQMDGVTQQNAALVEQAAAAAESLQDQAAQLEEAVSLFKLGQQVQARVKPQMRKAAAPARQAPRLGGGDATKPASRQRAATQAVDWEQF